MDRKAGTSIKTRKEYEQELLVGLLVEFRQFPLRHNGGMRNPNA